MERLANHSEGGEARLKLQVRRGYIKMAILSVLLLRH